MKRLFVLCLFIVMSAQASVTNLSATRMRISIDRNATNIQVVGDAVFSNSVTFGGIKRSVWVDPTNGQDKIQADALYPSFTNAQNDMDGIFTVAGAFNASGAVAMASTLDVDGATSVAGAFNASGAVAMASTLDVDGATSVAGALNASGAVAMASTLGVTGDVDFVNLTVSTELDAKEQSDEVYALAYGSLTYAAFTNALANASDKTLVVDGGTWAITDDVTIPSNVAVSIRNGSTISVASGKTVDFVGFLDAGRCQVFAGGGVQSVSNQVAYPEWWGAVADDGVDDSSAVNKCIQYGAKVVLMAPNGVYDLDVWSGSGAYNVIEAQNDQTIDLNGSTLRLIYDSTNVQYRMFRVQNVTNFVLKNGTLVGRADLRTNAVDYGQGGYGVYIERGSRNIFLKDLEVMSMYGDGCYIDHNGYGTPENINISDCVFKDNFRNNLTIEAVTSMRVSRCDFSGASGHGPEAGVDIELNDTNVFQAVRNVVFDACSFENNSGAGLQFSVSDTNLIQNVDVEASYFRGNNVDKTGTDNRQIYIGYNRINDITFTDCEVKINSPGGSTGRGVLTRYGGKNLTFRGTRFYGASGGTSSVLGVELWGFTNTSIQNCNFHDLSHAVASSGAWPTRGVLVANCFISIDNTIADYERGIYFESNTYDTIVSKNVFVDNTTDDVAYAYGVLIRGGENHLVDGNVFSGFDAPVWINPRAAAKSCNRIIVSGNSGDAKYSAITCYSQGTVISNSVINGNVFEGNGASGYGIYATRSSDLSIGNNSLSGFDSDGIYVNGNDSNSLSGFIVSNNRIKPFAGVNQVTNYGIKLSNLSAASIVNNIVDFRDGKILSPFYTLNVTNAVFGGNIINSFFDYDSASLYSSSGGTNVRFMVAAVSAANTNTAPTYIGEEIYDSSAWYKAKGLTTNDWLQISN